MYIDYSKLWKLLIDKNMTKTELMEFTGLSSRVLAKLSKNETVTTDTLLKICTALHCDISDIMECTEESSLSLYNCYKKLGRLVSENELYKTIRFSVNDKEYVVYLAKKRATKGTIINCKQDGTIYWEQLYPFGGIMRPSSVEGSLIKPIREKGEIAIVLISGKPSFRGLDEGIFVSSRCKLHTEKDVYVMSETAFKLFKIN